MIDLDLLITQHNALSVRLQAKGIDTPTATAHEGDDAFRLTDTWKNGTSKTRVWTLTELSKVLETRSNLMAALLHDMRPGRRKGAA